MTPEYATGSFSLAIALVLSTEAVGAFTPRHRRRLVPRRAASFSKNSVAAFADPSEFSPTTSTSSSSPPPPPPPPGPPFRLKRIDHVVIRCQNFPAMFDFYHRILGCTIDEPRDEHVNRFGGALTHLRAGSCYIDLLAYDAHHLTEEGRQAASRMHAGGMGLGSKRLDELNLSSETSTLDHLCLRVDPFDEKQLMKYLEGENVRIVAHGDQRLGADGVGPSVYASDPEGNVIELKGSPNQTYSPGHVESSKNSQFDGESHSPDILHERSNDDLPLASDPLGNSTPAASIANESEPADVPLTPCNRICRYNSSFYDGRVCIGCFREGYEIQTWQSMNSMQKSMTLLDAIDRCSENQGDGATRGKFEGAITTEELTRQYLHWTALAET